jgi:hypothetical protein
MSYEGKMLKDLEMPTRKEVEEALLKSLFKHNGVIKEFGVGEEIVEEIADYFVLNREQRNAYLETIYRKENRVKKSSLWHRLLFRAADSLAKEKLISRPAQTLQLTKKREWMLTENGFDKALIILRIPKSQKNFLSTKSYEVQKIIKKLKETPRPENYNPLDKEKRVVKVTKELSIRERGFRQAVIEAYGFKCAVCGLKINSPDSLLWEVEAAHIVPHHSMGRDDIWNGISLCHLHHWAFDVGWFTLLDDYKIQFSRQTHNLPAEFGKIGDYELITAMINSNLKIHLPERVDIYPHQNAIRWHRENIFYHA